MVWSPTDDELLALVSRAFDEALPPIPAQLAGAARNLRPTARLRPPPTQQVHRVERHLAAAAASGTRRLQARFTSLDGSLVTEVEENDEGRMVLRIHSADPSVLYVGLSWTLVDAIGVGATVRLVTPLAVDRGGASVRYDAGPVEFADAIDVTPAEVVAATAVTEGDVAAAFLLGHTGSARRAWQRAAALHRAAADPLADLIETRLQS